MIWGLARKARRVYASSMANNNDGHIILDTPEQIIMARFLAARAALRLQVRTGMKLSRGRSAIQIAQQSGWTTKRTAKGALNDLNDIAEAMGLDRTEA